MFTGTGKSSAVEVRVSKLEGAPEERAAAEALLRSKAAEDARARGACMCVLCPSAPYAAPARHAPAFAHLLRAARAAA